MKLAVLADIHANFIALQSVAEHLESWKPDGVIVAGDIVNRGPRPLQCLDFVREKANTQGWLTVRGNHEDYVISRAQPDQPRSGPFFDVHRGSYWTYQQLNRDVSPLEAMPFQQTLFDREGGEVRITHASMRGNRDGVYPETSDETLKKQMGLPPALFCVGHTHRPLIRRLCGALVVNAGSAGLPFDGDRRPAYARLTLGRDGWQAEIVRVEYDHQAAVRDFYESGFMDGAGPLARLVMIELREARSQLFQWASLYQDRALKGEISMEDSVREFLE